MSQLIRYASGCKAFAMLCAGKNDKLETYKLEADKVIGNQEKMIQELEQDIKFEKARHHWINPWTTAIGGIALGLIFGSQVKF